MTNPRYRVWVIADQKMLYVSSIHFNSKGIQYIDVVGQVTKQDRTYASKTNRIYRGYVLMQGTGLTDKNGKMIYGGDVVEWQNKYLGGQQRVFKGFVKWQDTWAGFGIYDRPDDTYADNSDWGGAITDLEIIGNIHQNPELVK